MKRRFEEILAECLEAQLAGRRSLAESLSLYPSLAPQLAPLLQTADDVGRAFDAVQPPAYLAERGRYRLLAAANERRRARQIARGVRGFDRSRRPWALSHWSLLGSGIAAGVVLLIAAVALSGGGDNNNEGGGSVARPTPSQAPSAFVTSLEAFQKNLDRARQSSQPVLPDELASDLAASAQQLATSDLPTDENSLRELQSALDQARPIISTLPDEERTQVDAALQDVASTTGLIWTPDAPTPAAEPTDGPEITPAPDTPAPSDTPAPTPVETPAPTPDATPTPEPFQFPS